MVNLQRFLRFEVIAQNGQQHAENNVHHQESDAVADCVAHHAPAVLRAEKEFEIPQPHPFAAQNAQVGVIFLECDHDAEHGQIVENQQRQRAGQREREQLQVVLQLAAAGREAVFMLQIHHPPFHKSILMRFFCLRKLQFVLYVTFCAQFQKLRWTKPSVSI